jgi:hypothetical protein
VALGDIDRDGAIDIVVADGASARFSVLVNLGGGEFARRISPLAPVQASPLILVDADGDGRTDVVANELDGVPSIFWNVAGGFAGRIQLPGRGTPVGLAAADLDGNGHIDVAALLPDGFTFSLGEGGRQFHAVEVQAPIPTTGLRVEDLDGGGVPDVAASLFCPPAAGFGVVDRGSDGSFAMVAIAAPVAIGAPLTSGDYDLNGVPDLAGLIPAPCAADPAVPVEPPRLVVLLNRTEPGDRDRDGLLDACEERVFHRGDANGDGRLDLVDAVFLLRGLFAGGPAPRCAEATDVDNDGDVDVGDAVQVLGFLFQGGTPPAPPGPPPAPCGVDPDAPGAPGDLGCEVYASC